MSGRAGAKPRPIARIVYDAERRNTAADHQPRTRCQFRAGDKILAVTLRDEADRV
jgi:hypothetical protein